MPGYEKPSLRFTLDEGVQLTVNERSLKRCDLCGALNLLQNLQCFVCGWHGHFIRDPELVAGSLEEMVRVEAELSPLSFTDGRTLARMVHRRSLFTRVAAALRRWFSAPNR